MASFFSEYIHQLKISKKTAHHFIDELFFKPLNYLYKTQN